MKKRDWIILFIGNIALLIESVLEIFGLMSAETVILYTVIFIVFQNTLILIAKDGR